MLRSSLILLSSTFMCSSSDIIDADTRIKNRQQAFSSPKKFSQAGKTHKKMRAQEAREPSEYRKRVLSPLLNRSKEVFPWLFQFTTYLLFNSFLGYHLHLKCPSLVPCNFLLSLQRLLFLRPLDRGRGWSHFLSPEILFCYIQFNFGLTNTNLYLAASLRRWGLSSNLSVSCTLNCPWRLVNKEISIQCQYLLPEGLGSVGKIKLHRMYNVVII